MPWKCVYAQRSDLVQVGLRRFVFSSNVDSRCALPRGYHDAVTTIGITPAVRNAQSYTMPPEKPRLDDQRWPQRCRCGYEFKPKDEYQVTIDDLYFDPANGLHHTLREAPIGWMWDAWWVPRKGPDGICLVVRLPPGQDWMVDGKAKNCNGNHRDPNHYCWTRSGPPPLITVSPSIDVPGYHGYLKGGVLTDGV